MKSQLEKAINLAKTTGDRIIVVDDVNNVGVVVMNLDEYERLFEAKIEDDTDIRSLTEQELLDKINRDIVIWKSENKERNFRGLDEEFANPDIEEFGDEFEGEEYDEEDQSDEDMYYYSENDEVPANDYNFHKSNNKRFFREAERDDSKKGWNIPSVVKDGAEDIS